MCAVCVDNEIVTILATLFIIISLRMWL